MTITQDMYNLINQPIKELYIKIDLLNKKLKKVDEIQGVTIGGNISVNVNSDIRKTCNIDIIIKDSSFLIGNDKKIFLDKYVKIFIGVKSIKTQKIIWHNQGIFIINNPSVEYSSTYKKLSFEGMDLMGKLTGNSNGILKNKVEIPVDTPINEAIRATVKTLGGFSNIVVEENNRVIPYDIEVDEGSTVYELLKKIRDLYMDFEMYFDENGVFYYKKIRNRKSNPLILNFNDFNNVILQDKYEYDFENVKNSIYIYGRQLEDGTQIIYNLKNDNINSPFSIKKIGENVHVVKDDNIFTQEQAQTRADYELWLHNDFAEQLSLNTIPIYCLTGNEKIYYKNKDLGIEGEYIIQNISIPLDLGGMNISAIKLR